MANFSDTKVATGKFVLVFLEDREPRNNLLPESGMRLLVKEILRPWMHGSAVFGGTEGTEDPPPMLLIELEFGFCLGPHLRESTAPEKDYNMIGYLQH